MKRNETAAPAVSLFPVMAVSVLSLLGVIASVVMLVGLHNKVQKEEPAKAIVVADEIRPIGLDKNTVRINLMKRNDGGKMEKIQQVEITLDQFLAGYQQMENFMDQLIEEGIINKTDSDG